MKRLIAALAVTLVSACSTEQSVTPDTRAGIAAAVNGAWRSAEDRARDQYRHPTEALTFWGLAPGMTIVEIGPGGAWWTHILAPYARDNGGRYIAAFGDLGAPTVTDQARQSRATFIATHARYGEIQVVDFSRRAGLALPDASVDFILVARAYHNWATVEGLTDRYMAEFARALRPGGILAVEQHRAAEGASVSVTAENGYVPEAYVIAAAERAGLELVARSEINANPRDTRDHPFGVWTLPPVRQSAPRGQPDNPNFDHAPYDAIGESDRMTLRFRRPS